MNELYNLCSDFLKTLSWIKWIDQDNGQLDNKKELKYPSALISTNSTFSDITEDGSLQREDATLQIRLAWDSTGIKTNANASDTSQDRGLIYTAQVKEAYELLQSTSLNDYEALECTAGQQETRNDGLSVYKFIFKTGRYKVK